MASAKVAVRCTIDFLPNTGEFDAVVAQRGNDETWHGCREQRFTDLQAALRWVEQVYPAMVALWQADQQAVSEKAETVEEGRPGQTVEFRSPWLDDPMHDDELKEELQQRCKRQGRR